MNTVTDYFVKQCGSMQGVNDSVAPRLRYKRKMLKNISGSFIW